MRVTLEIVSSAHAGRQVELEEGQTLSVGRTIKSDFATDDTFMSGEHFALERAGATCRLRDLKSRNGTFVNDKRVKAATLRDGDRIAAGNTKFIVRIEGAEPAPTDPTATRARSASPKTTRRLRKPPSSSRASSQLPSSAQAPAEQQQDAGASKSAPRRAPKSAADSQAATPTDLLEFLRNQDVPLFALLDAARDPQVLALLSVSEEEHQSLYEGSQGEELAAFAPYLVRLPRESALLERLASAGWGQSWGVYLTSDRPFDKLRRYLRQFLLVKLADGREAYFRFYDPRVLRLFLPTCSPAETERFFGAVERFLVEAEQPTTLLSFAASAEGVKQETLPLLVSAPATSEPTSADAER